MSEKGRTAYLTGGASGIGKATANMLADKGIKICIADRDIAGAQAVAKELNDAGKPAIAVECNVTDWDSQVAAFDKAVTEFGRIDYVLPIAGVGERRWLKKDQTEKWTKPDLACIDINLTGPLYTISLAVQQFRRQEKNEYGFRGKLLCVASVCGFYCAPTLPIYTASKHGMVGLTRTYGKYLPEEGITMNSICPHIVRTNISTDAFYDKIADMGLICDIKGLLMGFEDMMGASKMSGECLEITPAKLGYTIRQPAEVLDEPSQKSLEVVTVRCHPMHVP